MPGTPVKEAANNGRTISEIKDWLMEVQVK